MNKNKSGKRQRERYDRTKPKTIDKSYWVLADTDNCKGSMELFIDDRLVKLTGRIRPYKEVPYRHPERLICSKNELVTEKSKDDAIPKLALFCQLTNKKCSYSTDKPKGCLGQKIRMPIHYHYIFCDPKINGDRKHKFVFVNQEGLERLIETNDVPFREWGYLHKAYDAIERGKIPRDTIPHPGTQIFHTLMSGKPAVSIYLQDRDLTKIEGTVTSFINEPLQLLISDTKESKKPEYIIPLNYTKYIFVKDYDFKNDLIREKALELLGNGHVVVPNRRRKIIMDYCQGIAQIVSLKERPKPFDGKEHDVDVWNTIRGKPSI